MTLGGFYPISFGVVVTFMGPGSMFFHDSMTAWGGFFDFLSIILFASFVAWYNISRMELWFGRIGTFLAFFLAGYVWEWLRFRGSSRNKFEAPAYELGDRVYQDFMRKLQRQ